MKMKQRLSVYLILALLPASCNSLINKEKSTHYFYNWDKSKVLFESYGAWSTKTEVDCDVKTFQVIEGPFAKDKNAVFYYGIARPNIDLKTFYLDKNHIPKDYKNVFTTYWVSHNDSMLIWQGANPQTFELIKIPGGANREMWGRDGKNYFRMLQIVNCDYDSFEILDESYSKDKNHVYYEGKVINGADPQTFKYDSKSKVYKDKNAEYSLGERK